MLLFLAVKVSFRVAREEITKKKEFWFFIFTRFIETRRLTQNGYLITAKNIHMLCLLYYSCPNTKFREFTLCLYYKLVSFRGLYKLRPRPDWSLLGVKFKISDEHPRPFYMGVPPRVLKVSCIVHSIQASDPWDYIEKDTDTVASLHLTLNLAHALKSSDLRR